MTSMRLVVVTGVISSLCVACTATPRPAEEPWRVSSPAVAGGTVSSHGWSAQLHGTTEGADLVLASGSTGDSPAAEALKEFTAPGDVTPGPSIDLSLSKGTVPPEGITVSRRLETAVSQDKRASLAYYDTSVNAWTAIPTNTSTDGTTLTAKVDHLTEFTHLVYNLFTKRRDKPTCRGAVPDWANEPTFFDDKHSPMRWCAGNLEDDPSVLVVKVAGNRSYGTAVIPAVPPLHVEDTLSKSLSGFAGEDVVQQLMTRTLLPSGKISDLFGGTILLPGGEEVELRFTEAQARAAGDRPLVTVDQSVSYAVAGQMYDAITAVLGRENRGVALATAVVTIAQCQSEVAALIAEKDVPGVLTAVGRCMLNNIDLLAEHALRLAFTHAGAAEASAVDLIKKARKAAIMVWLGGKALQVTEWFVDREMLDGAAWRFTCTLKPPRLTFNGYGPLTVGMTAAEAQATNIATLSPHRVGKSCTQLTDQNFTQGWETQLSALILTEGGRIVGVDPPKGVRTDKGVGVGATADQVLGAYPGHRTERFEVEVGDLLLVEGPGSRYLGFELDARNVVTNIRAGERDYASAFELCSGA